MAKRRKKVIFRKVRGKIKPIYVDPLKYGAMSAVGTMAASAVVNQYRFPYELPLKTKMRIKPALYGGLAVTGASFGLKLLDKYRRKRGKATG